MIWLILILIAGAILIKLGALTVLITVLTVSLKVVIGLIALGNHAPSGLANINPA